MKTQTHAGFTLLEVLVALAILAITMAAISRAVSSNIQHADAMQARVLASWVAQNQLALHQARGDWLSLRVSHGETLQAGRRFTWREEVIATPNPTMRRIVVQVYAPEDSSEQLSQMTAYLAQYSR